MKKYIKYIIAVGLLMTWLMSSVALGYTPDSIISLQLGASSLAIEVPYTYIEGKLTEEDLENRLVAYYYSDEFLVDFEVYERKKVDTLEEYEAAACESFDGTDFQVGEINGYKVVSYHSVKEDAGVDYNTITYCVEDNEEYIEVMFWLDGDEAEEYAESLFGTLKALDMRELQLAYSDYYITCPMDYRAGYINEDDSDDAEFAYYFSEAALLDFYIYVINKEPGMETLDDMCEAMSDLEGCINCEAGVVNDIPVVVYDGAEQSGLDYFPTRYFVMDDGDSFVLLAFWRYGVVSQLQADAIIKTLEKR